MKALSFPRGPRACRLLGLTLLALLTGCTSTPRWGAWSKRPTDAQIAAVLNQPEHPARVPTYAMQQR